MSDQQTVVRHTLGPWTYDFAPEPGHASEFMVLGPRNSVLAYVGADEARDVLGPKVEANARLIAAAPEMLALLDRLRLGCGLRAECRAEVTALLNRIEGRT